MSRVTIANLTRKTTLAQHARVAGDPISRAIGLLGRRGLAQGDGLVLRPCSSIHMFGMRFAIDALYLDAQGAVVHAVSHLAPWRIGPIEPRAEVIIELPSGTLVATQTVPGDEIALQEVP